MRWDWREHAACDGMDVVLFCGREGESAPAVMTRTEEARAVCAGCPVLAECLRRRGQAVA